MKNVTEMTNTEKSPNKVNIFYITQNQRNSITSKLRIRPIYPQL